MLRLLLTSARWTPETCDAARRLLLSHRGKELAVHADVGYPDSLFGFLTSSDLRTTFGTLPPLDAPPTGDTVILRRSLAGGEQTGLRPWIEHGWDVRLLYGTGDRVLLAAALPQLGGCTLVRV